MKNEMIAKKEVIKLLHEINERMIQFDSNVGMCSRNEYNNNLMISPYLDTKKVVDEHKKIMEFIFSTMNLVDTL